MKRNLLQKAAVPGGAVILALLLGAHANAQSAMTDVEAYYQKLALDKTALLTVTGEGDPTLGAVALDPKLSGAPKRAASGKNYFIMQFDHQLDARELDGFRGKGWEFMGYVPHNGYIVRTSSASRASIALEPGVRWSDDLRPGYKMENIVSNAILTGMTEGQKVVLNIWPDESRKNVAEAMVAMGIKISGTPSGTGETRIYATVPPDRLVELASMSEVEWIEPEPTITLRNDSCTGVAQSGVVGNRSIWDKGIRGEGQMIGVADGPMAITSCYFRDLTSNVPGPAHRKVQAYFGTQGSDSHGTHTSGTSAGFNSDGTLANAGHAYMAKLVFTNYDDITGISDTGSSNFKDKLVQAQTAGAFIHTNSWGADGITNYTLHCVDIDRYTYENENGFVCFASTNASGVLYTPENAKNVVAVGNASHAPSNLTPTSGSCVGPTADGRRKPEVFLPGTNTVSASTSTCSTVSLTGTSMASPAVGGSTVLIRQYFVDGFYPTGTKEAANTLTPSGALLKATLLNSTVNMTPANYPSNQEGWGAAKLDDALYFEGEARRLWIADKRKSAGEGIAQGATEEFSISVTDAGQPFKATLVWMDPPAARNTSSPMINNLNLEVIAPDGNTYKGNVFTGGVSATGGTADAINNVEQVLLADGPVGNYTVRVIGTTVNALNGDQGYAVAVTGALGAGTRGSLSFDKTAYACGTSGTIRLFDGNLSAGSTTVTLTAGSDTETVNLPSTGTGKFEGTFNIGSGAVTPNDGTLQLASGTQFTATYNDIDTGTGPEAITRNGRLDCDGPVVSGVTVAELTDTTAKVTFQSDEPLTGTLRFSASCGDPGARGAVIEPVTGGGYEAVLTDLTPGTRYFASLVVEDALANERTVDNGGSCYPFTTFIREVFFEDDIEPDGSAFTIQTQTGGTSAAWRTTTDALSHSPTHCLFVPDHTATQDARVVSPSVTLGANGGFLSFWHTFAFESTSTSYDGGVIEIAVNGSATWTDLGANIVQGGYNGTLVSGSNPLAGRPAWVGGAVGPMTQVVVDLSSYAGQNIQVRWRAGADSNTRVTGWYVDDISFARLVEAPATEGGDQWSVK